MPCFFVYLGEESAMRTRVN